MTLTVERTLHVALLSPCFWPEVRRGGERFTRELANGLLANGHRASLITSHPSWPSRRTEDGLEVIRLPRPPQGQLLRRGFIPYLTHVPLSYAALRHGDYDVAHAVYATDALAAARWGNKTGRPALLSYLGIPDHAGLNEHRGTRDILERALAGCDAVVALSEYAADAFRACLGYHPRVIPPGVDLRHFTPAPRRDPRPTIVCSAAADVPRKHVALLVEAFALIRRELPEARLVLSEPRDREAARRAGVDLDARGVAWTDLDDRAALARAYGEASVTVLPSRDEAFGLVLSESLACGTPVVGYAHAAIPEIIDSPAIGRLFHELEPAALAGAILQTIELAADPDTADRCRARAQELSTDRCAQRYEELYLELLNRA